MNRLRYLMKLLEGFRLKYFFNLILVLAVGLLTLVNPYLTKVMSDDIIMNRKLDILFPVLFLFLITTIARSFIKYYYSLSYEKISQKINFDLKNEGYKKIMHLDQEYFNTHRTGDIMTLMTSDIDLIRHFFGFIFYNIIEGLTIFFGAVIIMLCTVNIGFTMFLVIMTPIISLYAVSFTKKCFRFSKQSGRCVPNSTVWFRRISVQIELSKRLSGKTLKIRKCERQMMTSEEHSITTTGFGVNSRLISRMYKTYFYYIP